METRRQCKPPSQRDGRRHIGKRNLSALFCLFPPHYPLSHKLVTLLPPHPSSPCLLFSFGILLLWFAFFFLLSLSLSSLSLSLSLSLFFFFFFTTQPVHKRRLSAGKLSMGFFGSHGYLRNGHPPFTFGVPCPVLCSQVLKKVSWSMRWLFCQGRLTPWLP